MKLLGRKTKDGIKKHKRLPSFSASETPGKVERDIIVDFSTIKGLEISKDPRIHREMKAIGDNFPGFVTSDNEIVCVARDDQSLDEAQAMSQLVSRLRTAHDIQPVIREATRPIIDSYVEQQIKQSIQERSQEGSYIVNEILVDSIEKHATDLHLEIAYDETNVYQRIFGQLSRAQRFNASQGENVINAVWNLYVGQNYSPGEVAKDGRFEFEHNSQKWLCRVSYGYCKVNSQRSLAMRLRDMFHIPNLELLGYNERQLEILKQSTVGKGITLIIGSVNSGKSTTQTAIMKKRPQLEKNLEISDQIEVKLKNFVQLQLPIEGDEKLRKENREKLRRISTRHDVDFIAINEIRDMETAAMATSMMLQGTSGIASIHGSSWTDAINRLISTTDLNVSPDILFSESFLSLIIIQSLIGVLCESCKLDKHPESYWQKYYETGFSPEVVDAMRFRNPEGCDRCRHSGIAELTLLAETIPVVESNRPLLMETTKPQIMREWMLENDIPNLHQHALEKISKGIIDPQMARRKIGRFDSHNLFGDWRKK